jgi:hypothetical protein
MASSNRRPHTSVCEFIRPIVSIFATWDYSQPVLSSHTSVAHVGARRCVGMRTPPRRAMQPDDKECHRR